MHWLEWDPLNINEDTLLSEAVGQFPQTPADPTPRVVWALENPASPFYLQGCTYLEDHDVIHILLGRGLTPQDEAFVVGFSMGNAVRTNVIEFSLFVMAARTLYPKKYRFDQNDVIAFNLGYDCGVEVRQQAKAAGMRAENIHERNFNADFLSQPLSKARELTGCTIRNLQHYFEAEIDVIPNSKTSIRLRRSLEEQKARLSEK